MVTSLGYDYPTKFGLPGTSKYTLPDAPVSPSPPTGTPWIPPQPISPPAPAPVPTPVPTPPPPTPAPPAVPDTVFNLAGLPQVVGVTRYSYLIFNYNQSQIEEMVRRAASGDQAAFAELMGTTLIRDIMVQEGQAGLTRLWEGFKGLIIPAGIPGHPTPPAPVPPPWNEPVQPVVLPPPSDNPKPGIPPVIPGPWPPTPPPVVPPPSPEPSPPPAEPPPGFPVPPTDPFEDITDNGGPLDDLLDFIRSLGTPPGLNPIITYSGETAVHQYLNSIGLTARPGTATDILAATTELQRRSKDFSLSPAERTEAANRLAYMKTIKELPSPPALHERFAVAGKLNESNAPVPKPQAWLEDKYPLDGTYSPEITGWLLKLRDDPPKGLADLLDRFISRGMPEELIVASLAELNKKGTPPKGDSFSEGTPTEQAAKLLAPALARNPFLSVEGLARMREGKAPLFNQFDPQFFKRTSPVIQEAMMGLYKALGIREEDLMFTQNEWRIPGLR